ncbi:MULTISPECIES: bifunctional aminoglycoside phosphotransferase/ATP-binding protein [unclassified Bradyrhizobium]|uniref:bifunctional aminoglycoside phosphotransferase/ATP-binding protein n=1 Tax=unclassified Bradyrhizobium TaxID=2631580 RepID=UPI0024787494|nr:MULTISPECIES: bifunctional aminoglycoside phosphotransferase/ATP-binding protein [unclassified Bradyrhizobium]WGS20926.1 AAA family ATPase [Bradyrhizobium sp. ISRA463]WGS27830.1 AAA family ATPase [Bradyrhizobium sp. ISRA464]
MTAPTRTNDREDGQRAVLAFMDKRVRSGAAKRVDTHISVVFLEPDRVLKIKRAVRLPFLDYSTLEKRKRACEAELAVNRRYTPELYRQVIPITEGTSGPEIGGAGPVLEWAVEMARFDERCTLDHLAAAGEIRPELGDALADTIQRSHENAEISDGAAWLVSIATIIDRNTDRLRSQPTLEGRAVEQLHERSHGWLASCRPLLERRASAGCVRRCHGDAHLGNVVLINQKPVLFDAIEFDPAMATTDVLYDLAFPLMDLIHFRSQRAAGRLFNRYLEPTWRDNGAALQSLSLFLSMRAAIRSQVLFTKCEQSRDVAGKTEATSYFELAQRLITPASPSLVAIGGMSGTGKSVLARDAASHLQPPPDAIILRSDVIRKELFDVDPLTALPESAYGAEVSERVYKVMFERAAQIIAQGFSVILDAAFLRESERSALELEARRMKADFRPIFLHADLSTRLDRVASRDTDASDATREVAARQEQYSIGQLDWPRIDASGSPEETLTRSSSVLLKAQRRLRVDRNA